MENTTCKEAQENVKKKRKWIKWVIILALAGALCAWLAFVSRTTQSAAYSEVPVTAGDLATYYNFDGLVEARRRQTVTSDAAGSVRAVYVSQNQQGKKGERLYKLDGGQTVEAEIDGEVTGLFVEAGGVVSAGEKTVEIIDMGSLEVKLNVDEYDVAAIAPGTKAEVTVLATGAAFEGEIKSLDKSGTASGDLSYYAATVALGDVSGAYPGMQASAKVLREQALGATLLRQDALQFDEYNKPFVYMRRGDEAEPVRVPVTVGVSDGVYCQITEGLRPGDTVLRSTGMSMEELMMQMRAKQMGR